LGLLSGFQRATSASCISAATFFFAVAAFGSIYMILGGLCNFFFSAPPYSVFDLLDRPAPVKREGRAVYTPLSSTVTHFRQQDQQIVKARPEPMQNQQASFDASIRERVESASFRLFESRDRARIRRAARTPPVLPLLDFSARRRGARALPLSLSSCSTASRAA
jgi:hypothetical protein